MDFILKVKIIISSSTNKIVGWENDKLKIKIHAIPEKGKANKELIFFLSKILKIPKSNIKIIQGETSKIKNIKITGINKKDGIKLLS